jgi:glycosyltransferase involved in cell wall biosynthesis
VKLALVHDWLTGLRGGEKCLEVLCRRFPAARLWTLLHRKNSTGEAIERMQITTSYLQHVPGIAKSYRWLLPLMPRAIESFQIPGDVDLVVSLSHAVAKSVRSPADVPHICYCFTPMRYAWHLRDEYLAYLEKSSPPFMRRWLGPALKRTCASLLDSIREWDAKSSDRVTHFVAISETVRQRIRDCYDRDSVVIYPPVDTDFFTPDNVARENYYLCVSALVPYKRIDLALDACNRLGRRVAVIGDGPSKRRLQKLSGPTVQFLGHLPDRQVRHHLRRCRALLFPGLEDLGIVPLEAQACGTPVIAFGAGGALETVLPGNESVQGSGVLVAEQTCDAFADAIERLERNPEQVCATTARRQALRFGQGRFEHQLIGYMKRVRDVDNLRTSRTYLHSAAWYPTKGFRQRQMQLSGSERQRC